MRRLRNLVRLQMLVCVACLAAGCGDDGSGPDRTPPPGEPLWSARFGDGLSQSGSAVAVHPSSGDVIVAAEFSGSVDFGGGALTSAGLRDFALVRLGPDGSHRWSKRFGNASDQYRPRVAVDAAGNVFLAGGLEGAIDFGGGALTSAGGLDAFLAKFTPDGSHLWSKRFGDGDIQRVNALAAYGSGSVVIAGILRGTVDFGGATLSGAGVNDVFLAQFAPDGAHIWSKRFGDASNQFPNSIAVDPAGNLAITGAFQGTLDLGGGPLVSAGSYDAFFAEFGPGGIHRWSRRLGDASDQEGTAIAADPAGNVFLAGQFQGIVDFGEGPLTSAGGYDVFVAMIGANGAHSWSRRFGDANSQMADGVTFDPAGNAIVTGRLQGGVDFGGGAVAGGGGWDVFLAKFGPDGGHLWSKCFGDAAEQLAADVAADASGNLLATGGFQGSIDFGAGALTSAGSSDVYIVKLRP